MNVKEPEFDRALDTLERYNFKSLMTMYYDWNNEVIAQFYATVWYEHPTDEKYEIMHFQIKGHPYYVSYARLAIFLVLILMIWTSLAWWI